MNNNLVYVGKGVEDCNGRLQPEFCRFVVIQTSKAGFRWMDVLTGEQSSYQTTKGEAQKIATHRNWTERG